MSVTRVVITGLGVVSPLGVGVELNWRRLLANHSGLGPLTEPEYASIPCRVAARVPIRTESNHQEGSLHFPEHFPRMSELKSMTLASAYALIAAQEAVDQSQVRREHSSLKLTLRGSYSPHRPIGPGSACPLATEWPVWRIPVPCGIR